MILKSLSMRVASYIVEAETVEEIAYVVGPLSLLKEKCHL
jgi:hypothetical protein